MSQRPRTAAEWDELAGRPSDDPARRGEWQVLLVALLVALVAFGLVATVARSLAVQVLVVVAAALLTVGRVALRRWRWRQFSHPSSSSITSRWIRR